ncbi:MAG TPA: YicC family protein [Lachnospiraceae bacterium]|nr:YicC family protein [Lachnospiraceae bacterium]
MIQSMTGFGRGEAANEKYKVTIEMKSVNHRYLDLSVRLPRKLNFYEPAIRNQVKEFAKRGKIDIFVSIEQLQENAESIQYNPQIAAAYLSGISQMADEFSIDGTIQAYQLARFPDVFTKAEEDDNEEEWIPIVTQALRDACEKFAESRRIEGEKLAKDLSAKLDHISDLVDKIETRSPQIVEEYRKKITEKVEQLLGDTQIDENLLATEIVMFSDKICVDEEMVRLRTHVEHVKETLAVGENIGRKLDFLIQEMNREANTTLSKANDSEVSEYGIDLKTEIEKIREQIQNIE